MNVDSLYTHLIFTIIELWTFLSPPKYLYHFPYSTSPIPSNPLQPQVTIGIFLPLRIGFVFSGVKYTFSSFLISPYLFLSLLPSLRWFELFLPHASSTGVADMRPVQLHRVPPSGGSHTLFNALLLPAWFFFFFGWAASSLWHPGFWA